MFVSEELTAFYRARIEREREKRMTKGTKGKNRCVYEREGERGNDDHQQNGLSISMVAGSNP